MRSGEGITSERILDEGSYPIYGGNGIRGFGEQYTHEGEYVLIGRQGALCGNVHRASGRFWASEHAVVATMRGEHSSNWFAYLLESMNLNQHSVSAAQPGLAVDRVKSLLAPVPPVETERQIATFLDRKTAAIDQLIQKKERLIEVLQEKRQALITQAVTKGLDPSVPMKDSGAEWLGRIPAHWQVNPLARLTRKGTSITYGIVQAGPHHEGGVPYIRTSDMAGDSLPRAGYPLTSPEIDAAYRRSKVASGDVVVAIRATVGKALPVPPGLEGANLTQGTAKVSPGPRVTTDFLLLALQARTSQQRFEALSKGATFKEITLEMLRKFVIAVPPLAEQASLAAAVRERDESLKVAITGLRRSEQLLTEYRQALISAAVTGQIDVSKEAA